MTWNEIISAAQLVITIGGFVWVLATQKANQDRLNQIVITGTQGQPGLITRTEGLERRVDTVEAICKERHSWGGEDRRRQEEPA